MLRREGFEVASVEAGEQALAEFARFQPDVVLLDVMMPGMNGFEVCRRLKSNPETRLTPVVLVTGLTASSDRVSGIDAGADDFLSKPIDRGELIARVRSLLKLKAHTDELERAETVLFTLALSIEARDPYTLGHCERLAEVSLQLAARVGLPAEQLTALVRAGYLHDIGKLTVPDAILLKAGPLTPAERQTMQLHPIEGERICSPLKSFRLVLPIIRHHHEKLDGSGYPDGLKGEQVPLSARILQIADVYDALATERPYKPAMPRAQALEVMENEVALGWWDPHLFAEFRKMIEQPGSTFPATAGSAAASKPQASFLLQHPITLNP